MLFHKKQNHKATSVMQFLYPEGNYQALPRTAEIQVPVNVGIAFVPEARSEKGQDARSPISEKEKARLLELVKANFDQYDFIGKIEPIPSTYLRRGGGFDSLKQAGGMFGVDVMVLLSYDQIQFNDPKISSWAYWTVVGLYVVKGETNSTQTLLDAVVIDIQSKNMLFRAPGTSDIKGDVSPLKQVKLQREQSASGFRVATADLVDNLDQELNAFRERIKSKKETDVQITYREGYSGAFGGFGVALALAALAVGRRRRR
ncbi:MAG: rhombotarget lipoprotein [Leptospirillia bacterium]